MRIDKSFRNFALILWLITFLGVSILAAEKKVRDAIKYRSIKMELMLFNGIIRRLYHNRKRDVGIGLVNDLVNFLRHF
jgi:hypothetical protein